MDKEPRFLAEYADELDRLGAERFRSTYPRPVVVGIGLLGAVQDREAGDLRSTMQADQAGDLRKPTSIQFRVFPLAKSANGLRGVEVTLGRGPENDIIIAEYSLSAKHCGFIYDARDCEVIDLGSRNGSVLNGETLVPGERTRMKDKSTLVLGRLKFRFLVADSLCKLVASMPRMRR